MWFDILFVVWFLTNLEELNERLSRMQQRES